MAVQIKDFFKPASGGVNEFVTTTEYITRSETDKTSLSDVLVNVEDGIGDLAEALEGVEDRVATLEGQGNAGLPENVVLQGDINIGAGLDSKVTIAGSEFDQYTADVYIGDGFLSHGQVTIGTAERDNDSVYIGKDVLIEGDLSIDEGVTIGSQVNIGGSTVIGENVLIPSGFNGNNISGGGLPEGVTLDTEEGPIILGTNTTGASIGIEPDVHIKSHATISEYVIIGPQVTLGTIAKGYEDLYISNNVKILENVNIGKNVTIPEGFDGSKVSGAIIIQ